jgi:hypothetical protein
LRTPGDELLRALSAPVLPIAPSSAGECNGAVKMKPNEFVKGKLLPSDCRYAFSRGKVHNLLADEFIAGHSDVTGPQVANALLQVVTS